MKDDKHFQNVATRSASPSAAAGAAWTVGQSPSRPQQSSCATVTGQLRDPDRYQIINEHGRGGLGRVSRAYDRQLGRDVAIKELISRSEVSEIRFAREAMITAHLEHPGIVPVHEAGRWPDGTPFYAMKLVAGRPLRDLITERTTVEARIALLHHVIAVADAIAYAHGRSIIHRDLKPSNVIIGDFGETIVIDWGLAKDLSSGSERVAREAALAQPNPDSNLTATGSVLGTPSYMAPEQERGQHVDQRADVFAIGAMLWELCSLQKVPPTELHLRHRMLRRAGIDQDLVSIIDKALESDPAKRYPEAGALAADLKAFKSGARIAARHYTPLGLLAHWTRRHRALALAVAAAIAVSLMGITLYVRNVSIERDHAESAKAAADAANAATAVALAEQTLGHAEVLLNTDPSAANELLRTYRGHDDFRLSLLEAEAAGRGVASMRVTPHTSSVLWLHRLRSGALATLSDDGTAAVTTSDGSVTVVARSPRVRDTWAFDEQKQLFAYACAENELCLLDFSRTPPNEVARLAYPESEGLAFSPDSRHLASVSRTGDLSVWDVSRPDRPTRAFTSHARGFNIGFLNDDTLVAIDDGVTTTLTRQGTLERIPTPGAVNSTASNERHAVAIGTEEGVAMLVTPTPGSPYQRAHVCDGPLMVLRFVGRDRVLAYGCKNGKIGLWNADTATTTTLATIQGSVSELAVTSDARYLAAGGASGAVSVIDLRAGTISSLLGHNGKVTALAPLGGSDQVFASGDLNGNVRLWGKPLPLAHVAYAAPARLFQPLFLGSRDAVATTSIDANMHFVTPDGLEHVPRHNPGNILLAGAPDGDLFASFGSQATIEVWSGSKHRVMKLIDVHNSETVQLRFVSNDELVYANNGGHLLRWSMSGGASTITTFKSPIATFIVLAADSFLVELRNGTLWHVQPTKEPTPIPQQCPQEHLMQLSKDRRWLATGTSDGRVTLYDTRDWQAVLHLRGSGRVHHVALSPANDLIAAAMTSGEVHVGRPRRRSGRPDWGTVEWNHFSSHPRFLAFSPSGDLLMVTSSDGVIWYYSTARTRWIYFETGAAGLSVLQAAPDGKRAATVDSSGRLMLLDLDMVRRLLPDGASGGYSGPTSGQK